jgi:dTDP-L-rhamnose 4-epimerase
LSEAMGLARLSPEVLDKARAGDVRHCFPDISLARNRLGYDPGRLLEDSLDELAEWIARSTAHDRGEHAKQELEAHGLVV